MSSKQSTISIDITPERDGTTISWSVPAKYADPTPSGIIPCYIPGFDIHYSVKSTDEIQKKALELSFAFFDFYMDMLGHDVRALLIALDRLGFKTPHSTTKHKMMKGSLSKSRFSAPVHPVDDEFYVGSFITKGNQQFTRAAA